MAFKLMKSASQDKASAEALLDAPAALVKTARDRDLADARKSDKSDDAERPEGVATDGKGQLPLIGRLPVKRQIITLIVLAGVFLLVGLLFVLRDLTQASNQAAYSEITGDSLMHSQRLAKAVPAALQGNADAFSQLRDSRDRLDENLAVLTNGGSLNNRSVPASSAEIQPTLAGLTEDWKRTQKNATVVLDNEKILTTIGTTLKALNDANPTLLELTEQIAALKLQSGAPAREISASSQLVMLTQRLAKNANELLSGEGVNPETAFLLGKDTNTFRDLLEGLTNGSDALRLTAARDPETRDRLADLQKQFVSFQQQIGALLANLQKIVAAKQAEQLVFKDNENLRGSILKLQQAYQDEDRARSANLIVMGVCAVGLLAMLAAAAFLYLNNTRAEAADAERRRAEAQRLEEDAKRQNDANQAAILRLMNELQEVADGDLTTQATVSEDITGAIADSVNYTVEELRTLVGRINSTAEMVTTASSQAQETSTRLLAASEAQSREIRNTGESVLRMARQINDVSSSAMESANVARQSLAAAEEGQRAVQNSIAGMNEIREQIQETSKRIKRLGESSQEIGEIIELISDITEQTNVLALNAAIQAASAGEAGRGFSVVAEEVQRLAERSAEATKQIGALVRTIQTDTQDAVAAMEKSTQGVVEGAKLSDAAGQALSNIGRVSRQLAELIEQISQNTSVQARSAGGVAQSIQHILTVNEETSLGTQKTADSISQLSALAQELKSSVARFKVS
jgi:twitching motility protein PilJ